MKVFSNFQELMDYVPNCIICGKVMEIHLKGYIRAESLVTSKWWYQDTYHFRLKLKDESLTGKCKNRIIAINPIDNTIILGQDTVSQLLANWITVSKKCYTCRCEITAKYHGVNLKNYTVTNFKNFPPLTLQNEEIYYTRKREKSVGINQVYNDDSSLLGVSTSIIVGYKPTKSLYIDFNRFKNLKQLNERISTILTFS